MSDADYLAAYTLLVEPILESFAPDLLLISAGFDAAEGDIHGKMCISPSGFGAMTARLLRAVACPVAAALEGGYNATLTSECCEATLRVLMGEAPPQHGEG